MAYQATLTITCQITGMGDNLNFSAQSVNAAAAPPGGLSLQAGNNTILFPSGATVNGIYLKPPPNSSNVKTIKGIAGDTGLGPWTAAPMAVPAAAGATIVIVSTSPELIEAAYY